MLSFASSLTIGYLTLTGTIASTAIMTRGLKRAFDAAIDGNFQHARNHALSAITAPAVMAVTAVGTLVCDCIRGASDLGDPVFQVLHEQDAQAA